jgi:hypothetical protein
MSTRDAEETSPGKQNEAVTREISTGKMKSFGQLTARNPATASNLVRGAHLKHKQQDQIL